MASLGCIERLELLDERIISVTKTHDLGLATFVLCLPRTPEFKQETLRHRLGAELVLLLIPSPTVKLSQPQVQSGHCPE